jgi:hypothetical protein
MGQRTKQYIEPMEYGPKEIIELLEGTGMDKRMQMLYDHYREMGLLREEHGDRNFLTDALVKWRAYDHNYLQFVILAKKAGKPIKREIQKLVRVKGTDGGEYIRMAVRFSSENRLEEEISTTLKIGMWEEIEFQNQYVPQEMAWVKTLMPKKTVPHYLIPWTSGKLKELAKDFVESPGFYIEDKEIQKKFTIDRETWMTKPRDEILKEERAQRLNLKEKT